MKQNIQDFIHNKTISNFEQICQWFEKETTKAPYPIYSSYDIRDSGYKVTNVDANIFPAGFNNICRQDKEEAGDLFKKFINNHYGDQCNKILLITEEHTKNVYYWENVFTIKTLIEESGREVKAAFPRDLDEPMVLESYLGNKVSIYSGTKELQNFNPDLIISNNDFSVSHEEWASHVIKAMNPPRELGWYQRKKSRYFKHYNDLVNEFAIVAGIDPFYMRVETEVFEAFDINSEESREALARRVDQFLTLLKQEYLKRGITQKPFVFVKNNAGTYGLAVIKVNNGDEIRQWTYKNRKTMKAAKGGRDVEEVIIQEGIPSIVRSDSASAEPVIYMIGRDLAGGFLRTHEEKSETESLNSPGAVYKRLCISDLSIKPEGCPQENVYGWTAKLGLAAIAREALEMRVQFKNWIS